MHEQKEQQGHVPLLDRARSESVADVWWQRAEVLITRLRYRPEDLASAGKSDPWKLAIAAAVRRQTTATNRWMSEHLHLGNVYEVSRKVNAWLREPDPKLARKVGLTPNPKA